MKYDYITLMEGKARLDSRFIDREYLAPLWIIIPCSCFLMITKAWVVAPLLVLAWFLDARQKSKAKHESVFNTLLKSHPELAIIYFAQIGAIPRVHSSQLVREAQDMENFLKDAPISQQEKDEIIKPYLDHMKFLIGIQNGYMRGKMYPEWVPIQEESWNNRTLIANVRSK